MHINIDQIRKDFPILHQEIFGKPLVYFDNAATTQKPRQVIDAITNYYFTDNSNIHRGVHALSQRATEAFEASRRKIQEFIHAASYQEIIFTKGTTDSINLLASSFGRSFINEGDEILITTMEHHSNIVPWQMICDERKAVLKVVPVDDKGILLLDKLDAMLGAKTKLLAITHVSNALGSINPLKDITQMAHQKDIPVLIDGAQAIAHVKVDVQDLDCDFYAFSAHKMFGPMGIGVLYGKKEWLDKMPPYQGGGEMIDQVSFGKTTYNDLPFKFEAGTPNVADVAGFDAAIDYIQKIGFDAIHEYENSLLHYAEKKLSGIEGVRIIGQSPEKTSVLSFLIDDIHPYDAGTIIDKFGIAVRTGHHCAQPLMDFFDIPGTIRASFAFYNTLEEVDRLEDALFRVKKMFA